MGKRAVLSHKNRKKYSVICATLRLPRLYVLRVILKFQFYFFDLLGSKRGRRVLEEMPIGKLKMMSC